MDISRQVPLSASMSPVRLHSSNPNLCAELVDCQTPVTRLTDSVECTSDYVKLQEEFCTIAQKGRWAARRAGETQYVSMLILQDALLNSVTFSYCAFSHSFHMLWCYCTVTLLCNLCNDLFSCLGAVHSLLKSAFNTVAIEKEKIKQILCDQDQSDQSAQISSLRKSLSQVMSCQWPLFRMPLSSHYICWG